MPLPSSVAVISPSNLALFQKFFFLIVFLDVVEQIGSVVMKGKGIQGVWQQERWCFPLWMENDGTVEFEFLLIFAWVTSRICGVCNNRVPGRGYGLVRRVL
jgi:hypothetical protein